MHDDRGLVETRIRRTISERIRPAIHGQAIRFQVEAWTVPGEPVSVDEAREAAYDPFEIGGVWGKPWGTTWFRMRGTVPPEWRDETVEARIVVGATDIGPGFQAEGLVYRTAGGGPIRGLHPLHWTVPVGLIADDDGSGGAVIDILVEAAANPPIGTSHRPTPLGDPATAGVHPLYRLHMADLAVRNDDVFALDRDLKVLTGLMRELADDDPRRAEILRSIESALDALDVSDLATSAGAARTELAPMFARHTTPHAHQMSAVGHAHIDSAWLWPLRETRRKCLRTFTNAVSLMDEYPDYAFVCSQAQQYAWIEEDCPELFAAIQAKVDEGRFIPVGSMWVEADANLPSGESLARQFVWGRRYFEEKFGESADGGNRICWIPDVFGYAGNLPQIMAAGGCDYFLTQKLSWNQTNPFPHHTFWWEGIDGTRIFTHFPPADTYNGDVVPRELAFAVRNFRDQGGSARSVYLFGHGDGGGGPNRDQLERLDRIRDLDGLPKLTVESPEAFFDASVDEYDDAAVWRGELYFEMHRGTYTSQAKTKWGNRRGELALRELEVWTALADTPPLAELERLWKVLLLHQFHDIIPGSSIAWVHDDTEADHAALLAETESLIGAALGVGSASVAANAGPFEVSGVVGDDPVWVEAPAHGVGTVSSGLPDGVTPVTVDGRVLENGLVRVAIGADGTIESFVDLRADRECLAGPANVLQLFPDLPNTYDAWDVDAHTLRQPPRLLTDLEAIETDATPLRGRITITRTFGDSSIVQTYVLRAGSARLDIETEVSWHENEKLLKAAFPLDVRADDARFDVQFGHVRRPTHRNTSWDAARFEVCGHFWADVAEPDFGVALLNDGKYGHDVVGDDRATTMRLSLLRAPNYPDPDADRGDHHFTYSLLPTDGGLTDVLRESWALNLPVRLVDGVPAPSIIAVDHPGVVVTAVKAADDGSGDLVVRAHEAFGGRARFRFDLSRTWARATPCDLFEAPIGDEVPIDGPSLRWELRPFEFVTLRLAR